MMKPFPFKSSVVEVGTEFTTLLEQQVVTRGNQEGFDVVNLEIENTGDTNAFSDLKIQLQDHPDGEFYDYLIASDFATAGHPNIPFVSVTAPDTLGDGETTHLIFKTHGAYAFKVLAKVASGTTTAVVRGYGRGQ